jgi:hypothetical protein
LHSMPSDRPLAPQYHEMSPKKSTMDTEKPTSVALDSLRAMKLGPFQLEIRYRPKSRVGHFDFDIRLTNRKGDTTRLPVVTGTHSKGNPSQSIQGWFDIHFLDRLDFDPKSPMRLSEMGGLDEDLFHMLGSTTSPGGMIIVSYVSDLVWGFESELHALTRQCLRLNSPRIPPSCTPLGWLLFKSGCRNIKREAYDVQGSSRLAGEMSLNAEYEAKFTQQLSQRLKDYLVTKPHGEFVHLEEVCRTNADRILQEIEDPP